MKQPSSMQARVERWIAAGLIDAPAGARILAFESAQERGATLRWPVLLAMIFGGILLAAGITLFVAAHWSELSPAARFSLVLFMVAVFHAGGAALAASFPALSATLHAIGTAALGAAIYLTAQIFNLHENWATGILLWSLGAAAGYLLLRDWVQAAFLALLAPAWLISQWTLSTQWRSGGQQPLAFGLLLTALTYLSARIADQENTARRTLVWIGGIALLPCVSTAMIMTMDENSALRYGQNPPVDSATRLTAWSVALAAPLILAWILRGRAVWINFLWVAWSYAFVRCSAMTYSGVPQFRRPLLSTVLLYVLCAVGSVGLVAWGLYEKRKERLNLGILAFAISVLFFYFDSFMGKLGRSASLLVLGLLCLGGGYVLEVARRRLARRMEVPA